MAHKCKLKVLYQGGAGMITTFDTVQEALDRLQNIAALDDTGGVVVREIVITKGES